MVRGRNQRFNGLLGLTYAGKSMIGGYCYWSNINSKAFSKFNFAEWYQAVTMLPPRKRVGK
jgi:hypothetical protein